MHEKVEHIRKINPNIDFFRQQMCSSFPRLYPSYVVLHSTPLIFYNGPSPLHRFFLAAAWVAMLPPFPNDLCGIAFVIEGVLPPSPSIQLQKNMHEERIPVQSTWHFSNNKKKKPQTQQQQQQNQLKVGRRRKKLILPMPPCAVFVCLFPLCACQHIIFAGRCS